MYSFLLRPLWILSHLLIAVLIVVLVSLGLWQRARYYEERGRQHELEAAAVAEPVAMDDVVDPGTTIAEVPPEVAYSRVAVSGVFDVDNEVLINNRSLEGSPGAWVLTPLEPETGGAAVAVVRGWVPLSVAEDGVPVAEASPPLGPVVVTGIVQLSQQRGSLGPVDPAEGHLDDLARVDLDRLAQQLPYEIAPVWVLLDSQEPATETELPAPVSLQPGDPSQNFSYMVQWWIFASVAVIGYPLILRSVARGRKHGTRSRRRRSMPEEIPWAEGLEPDPVPGAELSRGSDDPR